MKKNSFFHKILIPLMAVMVLQAGIAYGTIVWSGTVGTLKENSVTALEQNVANKSISLQNSMLQRWSDLDEVRQNVEAETRRLTEREGITASQLVEDPELSKEWLSAISEMLLYELRVGSVSGSFAILDNGTGNRYPNSQEEYYGLYFRDLDPLSNPAGYTDVLLERGPASVANQLNIPLDSYWTSKFRFDPDNGNDGMEYFFKPYLSAYEHPDMSCRDLGYWSDPFLLESGSLSDPNEVIAYSVPLVEDGVPYGVLGVGVSADTIAGILRPSEIDGSNRGGYLIAERTRTGETRDGSPVTCRIKSVFGAGIEGAVSGDEELILRPVQDYRDLYVAEGISLYESKVYLKYHPLNLYSADTPFAGSEWMLLGAANGEALFGEGNRLNFRILGAVGLSLLAGLISIYLVSLYTTKPIIRLADRIQMLRPDEIFETQPTRVREIDELSRVIHRLTCNQKKIENKLMEERERYLIALDNITDIVIEYEKKEDRLVVYQLEREEGGEPRVVPEVYEQYAATLRETGYIHPEDLSKVMDFLEGESNEQIIVRLHRPGQEKYRWFSLKGKSIYDENRELVRIIASTRDITEEKEEEQRRKEEGKRDRTTGFYRRETGEYLIKKHLWDKPSSEECVLAILDLDGFRELNERYGLAYCDILLEEASGVVKRYMRKDDVAMRFGGDETVIFLPDCGKEEAERLIAGICAEIRTIYTGEESGPMSCSGGMDLRAGKGGYSRLLEHAQYALEFVKLHDPGRAGWYEDAESEGMNGAAVPVAGREPGPVQGRNCGDGETLSTLAYTIFDNTRDIKSAVGVLLGKLGREFGLHRIIILSGDKELYTNHIMYQWAEPGAADYPEAVERFTAEDFGKAGQLFKEEGLYIHDGENTEKAGDAVKRLLRQGEEHALLCFTMFDNGEYFGNIVWEAGGQERVWGREEKETMGQISHIISSYLSKSRSDLASKAKGEFLSRMSHEIRTPMNAIIGMTLIAEGMEETPPKVKDCLGKIDMSAKYLLSIINDILDMSRIESGKMSLEEGTFAAREVLDELDTLMRPQAEVKQQEFVIRVDAEDGYLKGDSLRLNQILVNLVSNAVKFTPKKGSIRVEVKEETAEKGWRRLTFSVEDTGIGISQEGKARIFDAFEQAGDSTARQYGGTGLGLAISSSLVRMMGGRLEVESEEGKGSRFFFTVAFPVSGEKPQSPAQRMEDVERYKRAFQGRRLLVAEDNELNMEIEQTILEGIGFIVEKAKDGLETLKLFSASPQGYYDAILMDIRMPNMDGLEATRAIRTLDREDARTVPIIATTANAFDEDTKKSIESGMNGHLSKPISIAKLYEVLAGVLNI